MELGKPSLVGVEAGRMRELAHPRVLLRKAGLWLSDVVRLRSASVNYILSLGLVVLVWQLMTSLGIVSPFAVQPPAKVADTIVDYREPLARAAFVTLKEILIGYGIAVGVGIALAVVITYSRVLRSLVSPALVVFQSVPKVAFAPILLIWFGFGAKPVVIMVTLLAVFPIVIQTAVGFELVDPELRELARSLRASRFRRFVKIDFPSALPSCFAGLKVGMTLAVIGAVVGELISTSKGLGYIIQSASAQGTVALSLASLVVLSVVGLALYQAVVFIERLAAPWHHEER
jgi:NitT/TauT family transport system permease protein